MVSTVLRVYRRLSMVSPYEYLLRLKDFSKQSNILFIKYYDYIWACNA